MIHIYYNFCDGSRMIVCVGLIDYNPIMSGIHKNQKELPWLSGGIGMLIHGRVRWLIVVRMVYILSHLTLP